MQTATQTAQASQLERSTIRKVSMRLVPFVALMFFINFLDRTAISFAGPNGMTKDLGLDAAQFGFAAGVFFIGYILLEVPSNLALHKFGARRWLARIMVTWGIVALLFTWVSSVPGLYTLRFLLGVAEAGFFPGAILFLSMWVPQRHRSHILALFYLAQPLTIVIGAPFAALLIGRMASSASPAGASCSSVSPCRRSWSASSRGFIWPTGRPTRAGSPPTSDLAHRRARSRRASARSEGCPASASRAAPR